MSLLSIESVTHRYRRGRREHVALSNVSMTVENGELVAVHGTRKAGKSTLMRVAAGLERPQEGVVRCEGVELAERPALIGRRIAFARFDRASFPTLEGEIVLDHVAAPLLAQGSSPRQAIRTAADALERLGAGECTQMLPGEIDAAECARVGIARALVCAPKLIVVDDPTAGVGLLESEPLLLMLRAISDEGTAVLMSTGEAACVAGADRLFALDEGDLRSVAVSPQAEVVPLRRPAAARSVTLNATGP